MRIFLLITFLASCVGMGIVGARLVRAGLRTRMVPELAYGASLLLTALGAVMRLVIHGVFGGGPEYHGWMISVAGLRFATLVALTLGLRAIYRPDRAWAWVLVGSTWLVGFGGVLMVVLYPRGVQEAGILYLLGDVATVVPALWGCIESFSYHGKMKRRLALGLADPLATLRFKIWGFAFLFAAVAGASLVAGTAVVGGAITSTPLLMAWVQSAALAMTVCTWLAFYPPRRLRNWALRASESRATVATAGASRGGADG